MKFICADAGLGVVTLEQDGNDVNIMVNGQIVAWLEGGKLHRVIAPQVPGIVLDERSKIAVV